MKGVLSKSQEGHLRARATCTTGLVRDLLYVAFYGAFSCSMPP